MANFDKSLPDYTEEELYQRLDNWDPRYGALASHELLRRQIVKLTSAIDIFNDSSDKSSKKLVGLTWTLVAFTIVLVGLTLWLIKDAHDQTSAQINIALNGQFFTPDNGAIAGAIERGQAILQPKGKFTTDQLDIYLGEFDVIDSAYQEGLLSESDLCDSFSYYIASTSENKEINDYLNSNQGFFGGIQDLAEVVKNSQNVNCKIPQPIFDKILPLKLIDLPIKRSQRI